MFVLDNSVAVAWFIADEAEGAVDGLLDRLQGGDEWKNWDESMTVLRTMLELGSGSTATVDVSLPPASEAPSRAGTALSAP